MPKQSKPGSWVVNGRLFEVVGIDPAGGDNVKELSTEANCDPLATFPVPVVGRKDVGREGEAGLVP